MPISSVSHTLFVAMLLIAFQWSAQAAQDAIELKSIAEKEVTVLVNGKKETKRTVVSKALPGEEIIYTTTFKNTLDKAAGDIVITNPVPNDSIYSGGSAAGKNTTITFSIDSGKTFSTPDKLTIKTADGKLQPAKPADYTHLRWIYQGELGVGKVGEVSFRAVIK